MDNVDERQLYEQFEKEMEALRESNERVVLDLGVVAAYVLIGQIQLALRHSQDTGPSARIARQIAEHIQRQLSANRPAIAEVARRGWDRQYDR